MNTKRFFKIIKNNNVEIYVTLKEAMDLFLSSPNFIVLLENINFNEELLHNDTMTEVIRITEQEYLKNIKN